MTNREIDALVHSRIFGKEILTQQQMRDVAEEQWKDQPGCQVFSSLGGFTAFRGEPFMQRIPDYSTDPAASDQLLDRMAELGWAWRITGQITGRFDAIFQRGTHKDNWGYAERDGATRKLSICLAALAAFGVEVK